MKYKILLMPGLGTFDDDIEIEGKTPKEAFKKKYGKVLKRGNRYNSNVVIWTGNKRVCYNLY